MEESNASKMTQIAAEMAEVFAEYEQTIGSGGEHPEYALQHGLRLYELLGKRMQIEAAFYTWPDDEGEQH